MGCGSSASKGSPDEQMANKKIEENLQQEKKKIFIKISNCCCWVLGNLENQQLQNK